MDGLVHVRFGDRDIILETAGYRFVHLVDDPESGIAVPHRIHDDADGKEIIDLVKRLVLVDHLLVNGEVMLHPAGNIRLYSRTLYVRPHFLNNVIDKFFPLLLFLIDLVDQLLEYTRLPVLEGQVVQFGLNAGNTEPLSDRSIDIHRLRSLLQLLLPAHVLEGAHVVQPVGKLYDNDAYVPGHGQEHLSQVFRLYFYLLDLIIHLAELCDAVHEQRHIIAEFLTDLIDCHHRVFDDIVQYAGRDGFLVHLKISQDNAHAQRMNDIRLTGFSLLFPVSRLRYPVGFFDHREVIGRVVAKHARL